MDIEYQETRSTLNKNSNSIHEHPPPQHLQAGVQRLLRLTAAYSTKSLAAWWEKTPREQHMSTRDKNQEHFAGNKSLQGKGLSNILIHRIADSNVVVQIRPGNICIPILEGLEQLDAQDL